MQKYLLVVFLFLSLPIVGQVNFTVYYEYGVSKLKTEEKDKLIAWLKQFQPLEIDSIQIIGFADSVGKVKNNLVLSQKRGESVFKIITGEYKNNVPIRIVPKGEKNKRLEAKDRRVELRIYRIPKSESVLSDSIISDSIKRCYLVDYYLLQCCHISQVNIKKKEYVKLEITPEDLMSRKRIKHYSISFDDNGHKVLKKLRWSSKLSGSEWWQKQRFETLIPIEDFKKNKVVVISDGPCDSCYRDPLINAKYQRDSCLAYDIFLNRNIQYKMGFLNFKSVKIRVPSNFLDFGVTYYSDFSKATPIKWEKSTKQKDYSYTRLKLYKFDNSYDRYKGYLFYPISKMMICCWLKNNGSGFHCGGCRFLGDGLNIGAELGNNRFLKNNIPYFGLTSRLFGEHSVTRLLLGVDTALRVIGSFRYQYNVLTVPLTMLLPIHSWKNADYGYGSFESQFNLYTGCELRAYRHNEKNTYTEINLHLGVRLVKNHFSVFTHYGYAFNPSKIYNKTIYPLLQTGLEFNIAN